MALFDIFKRKKKEKKVKEEKKIEEKPKRPKRLAERKEVKEEVKKPKEVKLPAEPKKERRKKPNLAPLVLKSPHITEKATDLAKENQYTFKVWPEVNKTEIKKAIEDFYKVDVLDVKIIKIPPKRRRLGRISGWKKGFKKAIIKVKKGQKIEVLPR